MPLLTTYLGFQGIQPLADTPTDNATDNDVAEHDNCESSVHDSFLVMVGEQLMVLLTRVIQVHLFLESYKRHKTPPTPGQG